LIAAGGAGAAVYLTKELPLENPAGLTIYPESGGQIAALALYAVIALASAVFTVILLGLEYFLSVNAPHTGPGAGAAVVGEVMLALCAIVSGGFALGYGWLGLSRSWAGVASAVGVGFGALGIVYGLVDVSTLAENGMPS